MLLTDHQSIPVQLLQKEKKNEIVPDLNAIWMIPNVPQPWDEWLNLSNGFNMGWSIYQCMAFRIHQCEGYVTSLLKCFELPDEYTSFVEW